jgi:phage head maturation protease
MELKHKYLTGAVIKDDTLTDRQIRVVVSTPAPDRVKDVMEPSGCDLSNYKRNPIVLADHNTKAPVGTAAVEIKSDRVEAVITFAPAGISVKADEYCGLYKAGVLNTVSPGFRELEVAPLPGGGSHIKRWELLELSGVAVPAQPDAIVTARSLEAANTNWKVGASRNLPIATDSAWDGTAAAKGIFEKADFDGDDADTGFARKGFLVYDAGHADDVASYQVPFAKLFDGRLMVTRESIAGAAEKLKSINLPDDVADKARAVLSHYEGEMSKTKDAGDIATKQQRFFASKDLYDASSLASVVQTLVSLANWADWERESEGDDSKLPEMLAAIARDAGAALVAMTAEEVAELIARLSNLPTEQKSFIEAGKSPAVKALRLAAASTKAGRKFSAANQKSMEDACKSILAGHDAIKAMFDDTDSGDEPDAETDTEKALPTGVLSERERDLELLRLQSC